VHGRLGPGQLGHLLRPGGWAKNSLSRPRPRNCGGSSVAPAAGGDLRVRLGGLGDRRRRLRAGRHHLGDDLVIVEPVGADGRPVPAGVRSDKTYVTGITNPTLPLIRFELTDQLTFLDRPCACGSAHQLIADVQGRREDVFTYPGGQVVHPHVFASVLRRDPRVVEYQVRQTPTGAEVLIVGAPADPVALGQALERQDTGKVRRFRPLVVQGSLAS
jgi:hypothetical protein